MRIRCKWYNQLQPINTAREQLREGANPTIETVSKPRNFTYYVRQAVRRNGSEMRLTHATIWEWRPHGIPCATPQSLRQMLRFRMKQQGKSEWTIITEKARLLLQHRSRGKVLMVWSLLRRLFIHYEKAHSMTTSGLLTLSNTLSLFLEGWFPDQSGEIDV